MGDSAPTQELPSAPVLFTVAKYWSFDHFVCDAAKRPLRWRFAAYLVLAPIFPETLTESVFQEKSAQLSQKPSKSKWAWNKVETQKAVPPAQVKQLFGFPA